MRVLPKVLFAMLVFPAAAAAQTEETRLALMVPNVGVSGAVEANDVAPINELLLARFQEMDVYKVFGAADMTELLEAEQRKMLLGCADDSCLAQIGGALGVNLVAKASVGKIGETFVFNLKVLNVATAEAEARCSKEVEGAVDAVLPAVRDCVNDVTRDLAGRYTMDVPSLNATRKGAIGPAPLFVAGGVAVAAGIATLALDFAAGRKADTLADDPRDTDAYDSGKSLQTFERITLGVTVVAAVSAGVLAIFTDFSAESPASDETVALIPTAGETAVGLSLEGSF